MAHQVDPTSKTVFFAYAGAPRMRAEGVLEAVRLLKSWGVPAMSWQDLDISGRLLITSIVEKIDESDVVVAEVSANNPNVLFEAGYAVAKGKEVILAIDESDSDALREWSNLSVTSTIGRIEYTGNSRRLAEAVFDRLGKEIDPLVHDLLSNAQPRIPNAVFAPAVPHKFNSADRLERFLERQTHLRLLASQDELGLGTLPFYASEIYRSSAGILHFMRPTRVRAETFNARISLMAGMVKGFDLPLLMVAEPGYSSPLDYRDWMFQYNSVAELLDHVDAWLTNIPVTPGTNKRLGRLNLNIELPIRSFGQHVAESEKDHLTDYFISTNEFEAILAGRAAVFTGRKGTGKTASMQQAVAELRKDRRNLVVPVKPSSYDLAALTDVLGRFEETSKRDYFLVHLWSYLLTAEMCVRVLRHVDDLPAGVGGDSHAIALAERMGELKIDVEADMATRLDDLMESLHDLHASAADEMGAAAERLSQIWQGQLLPVLRPAVRDYGRIAVLVDNLDKTWEKGVDFETLSRFLLSLLVTAGRLKGQFSKSRQGEPRMELTVAIFLRTDIYDVMKDYAREPDKINPQSIQWGDEELLIRVLEDRYAANATTGKQVSTGALWSEVFCPEVHSMPTRDYFLWRAIGRPRDIIYLGNAALTTAINRRHDQVLVQDFDKAEDLYSNFAVDALLVESEAQGFDLEEILYEFAGVDATLTEDGLNDLLAGVEDPSAVVAWLLRTSFLGLEMSDGRFEYVEGDSEVRRKLRAAERLAERLRRPRRFRVHPAFRPHLGVRDDDLLTGEPGDPV